MNPALRARQKVATSISRKLLPSYFSIISDDCWGGQIYRQLRLSYTAPTVGLWIHPRDYLAYIEQFERINQSELTFLHSDKDYPVAVLSGVEIHFMHFNSEQEARDKFYRRMQRICRNNLLIKIDFGKPGYTRKDIGRWNKLKIPNSVAFYPPSLEVPPEGIHNGVFVSDWVIDGAKMFDITRKHFDIFKWIRSGTIESGRLHKLMNILLFDPTSPRRIANKAMEATSLARRASS